MGKLDGQWSGGDCEDARSGWGDCGENAILFSLMDMVAKLLWMCCRGEGSPSWDGRGGEYAGIRRRGGDVVGHTRPLVRNPWTIAKK